VKEAVQTEPLTHIQHGAGRKRTLEVRVEEGKLELARLVAPFQKQQAVLAGSPGATLTIENDQATIRFSPARVLATGESLRLTLA